MIKVRVAEAIVKELFQVNGYRVYDYGMERTLPEAIENIKYQSFLMHT
jgi:methanogenic corrinoid protein MtbC1